MNMNSVDRVHEYSSLEPEHYMEDLRVTSSTTAAAAVKPNVVLPTIKLPTAIRNPVSAPYVQSVKPPSHATTERPVAKDIEMGHSWTKHGFELSSVASNSSLTPDLAGGKWPTEGCVEFRHICMQYKSSTVPVLR